MFCSSPSDDGRIGRRTAGASAPFHFREADVRAVELARRLASERLQPGGDSLAQELEHLTYTGTAGGGVGVDVGSADEHRSGAERERLEHVAAPPDPPVDVHLDPTVD